MPWLARDVVPVGKSSKRTTSFLCMVARGIHQLRTLCDLVKTGYNLWLRGIEGSEVPYETSLPSLDL